MITEQKYFEYKDNTHIKKISEEVLQLVARPYNTKSIDELIDRGEYKLLDIDKIEIIVEDNSAQKTGTTATDIEYYQNVFEDKIFLPHTYHLPITIWNPFTKRFETAGGYKRAKGLQDSDSEQRLLPTFVVYPKNKITEKEFKILKNDLNYLENENIDGDKRPKTVNTILSTATSVSKYLSFHNLTINTVSDRYLSDVITRFNSGKFSHVDIINKIKEDSGFEVTKIHSENERKHYATEFCRNNFGNDKKTYLITYDVASTNTKLQFDRPKDRTKLIVDAFDYALKQGYERIVFIVQHTKVTIEEQKMMKEKYLKNIKNIIPKFKKMWKTDLDETSIPVYFGVLLNGEIDVKRG